MNGHDSLLADVPKGRMGPLTKRVLFVDHGRWCGEPHQWIREFFSDSGYRIIESPQPLWMDAAWKMPAVENAYVNPIGYDLRKIMRATVKRQSGAYGRQGSEASITDRLLPVVFEYWEQLRGLILKHRPRHVVVFGDYRVEAQLTWMLCRALGIRVLAIEGCFLRDRFIIEDVTGRCGNRNSYTWLWNAWKDAVLSPEERGQLYAVVCGNNVGHSHDGKIRQPDAIAKEEARSRLGIPEGRPVALVIGQVAYDSVIAEDLIAFESSLAFNMAAIEAFSTLPDWYVVVRCHPKEAKEASKDATARALRKAHFSHDRVRIVSGEEMNTYSLMDLARFGMTINSQAGIEMLLKGKPMLLCGKSFYGGQGFTLDVTHPSQMASSVEYLSRHGDSVPNLSTLERFCYHYIFDYLVERTQVATYNHLRNLYAAPEMPSV